MDRHTTTVTPTDWKSLRRFSEALQHEIGATHVFLFGSRARGEEHVDSDYDLIVVSPRFDGVHLLDRGRGLRELWMRVGGYGSMDLICMTPEEFEVASRRISLIQAVLPELVDLLAVGAPPNGEVR
jgi:predicted nucleotidyltransferase